MSAWSSDVGSLGFGRSRGSRTSHTGVWKSTCVDAGLLPHTLRGCPLRRLAASEALS